MNTGNIVVLAFSLVIIVLFTVIIIDYISPMFVKAKFDTLCRNYLLIAEANNGLSKSKKIMLEEELRKLGVEDIVIRIAEKDSVARRKEYVLSIECRYRINIFRQIFERKTETVCFKFERGFLARRILE